jgi:hypothetical protein
MSETTTRRTFLRSAAAAPALALPAVALCAAVTSDDPMIEAINAYRAESARNNASEDDVPADGCQAFGVLCSQTPVPTTREGAMEALRLTIEEEIENCSDDFPISMMTAVLRWLETTG